MTTTTRKIDVSQVRQDGAVRPMRIQGGFAPLFVPAVHIPTGKDCHVYGIFASIDGGLFRGYCMVDWFTPDGLLQVYPIPVIITNNVCVVRNNTRVLINGYSGNNMAIEQVRLLEFKAV